MSKKRPPPRYVAEIRRALTSDADRSDWPEDLAWARAALGGDVTRPPVTVEPEVVVALIEELLSRDEVALITRLTEVDNKTVYKPARAAVHRLRTRKVDVSVPSAAPRRGSGQELDRRPRSLITAHDAQWEREVGLVDETPRGISLVLAHVSARHGLLDSHQIGSLTRKSYREIYKRLESATTVVDVEDSVARWYIEDAVVRCSEAGRGLPRGFARISQQLGAAPGGPHPALSLDPAEVSNTRLLELYQEPELQHWFPDQLFLRQLEQRLQEVLGSKLLIDEQQRRIHLASVLDRALEEFYTAERRRSARQLLLDTAHVAALQDRGPTAGAMRAAAELYQLPAAEVVEHPFCRYLLERLINMPQLEQSMAEASAPPPPDDKQGGGIIIP